MDVTNSNSPRQGIAGLADEIRKRHVAEGSHIDPAEDGSRIWPEEPDPDPENHASHRAPNQADTTRTLETVRGHRLPLSAKRWRLARSFLRRSEQSNLWKYKDDADIEREPENLEQFKDRYTFDTELHKYFNFRIDYYPGFESDELVDNVWFADINDEMIEAKFPRDMDVRAFISGYHISVRRNQWLSIIRKRIAQGLCGFLVVAPMILTALFFSGASSEGNISEKSSIMAAGLLSLEVILCGAILMMAMGLSRIHLAFLNQQVTQVMQGNSQTLNGKIQRRLNVLRQNFTRFYKAISEEEFSGANSEGAEWTDRARWWTRLAMWNPKRIEYIEKFLQSEMQRIRVFRRWSDATGNSLAIGLLLLQIMIVLAIMFSLGPQLTNVQFGVGIASICVAGWITFISTGKKFSVQNSWIKRWIGDDDWPRFSNIGLDVEIGEIVRRDKDRIRQEKMRGGGFGANTG